MILFLYSIIGVSAGAFWGFIYASHHGTGNMFAELAFFLDVFVGGAIGLGIGTLAGFIHQFILHQKKDKIKPDLVACGIIASNIAVLLFPLFSYWLGYPLDWVIRDGLNSVAVHPQAIARVLRYLPYSGLLIGFWPLLMVYLGIGAFFRKNAARITIVVYSAIHVSIFLLLWLSSGCRIKHYTLSFLPAVDAFTSADHSVLVILIPILYIFYFTRPAIKSQYK